MDGGAYLARFSRTGGLRDPGRSWEPSTGTWGGRWRIQTDERECGADMGVRERTWEPLGRTERVEADARVGADEMGRGGQEKAEAEEIWSWRTKGRLGQTRESQGGWEKARADGGRLGQKVGTDGGMAEAKEFRFLPKSPEI